MLNRKPAILVIDDEACVRHSLKFVLRDEYKVLAAPGALEGRFYLSSQHIDIVLLDIRLRGTDGLRLLYEIKQKFPYIEIIMITAYASLKTIRKAIRYGAFDYLIKPFDKNELRTVVRNALKDAKNRLAIKNELDKIKESTLYLEHLIGNARQTIISSSRNSMTAILLNIHSRDGYTWAHAGRVTRFSALIAEKVGITEDEMQRLKCSAFLHDIGKVTVDGAILEKESTLTEHEFNMIKRHPEKGAEMIKSTPFPDLIIPSIRHHHERYDGSGYPDGLTGEEIPYTARILAVADAIDAMIYSPARQHTFTAERVERELRTHSGTQFDPELVDVVIKEKLLSFA